MAIPSVNQFANNPGGGLVTALGGINALRNSYYDANYNKAKSEYAPYSLSAEAASKLAYAQMMGPQFLAKVFRDPDFLAGLTEEQRSALPDMLLKSGLGQLGGNSLNQMPRSPQMGQQMGHQSNNSLLDYMKHGVQSVLGNFGMGTRPNQNAMNMNPEPVQNMPPQNISRPIPNQMGVNQDDAPIQQQSGDPDFDEALAGWQKSPEGQKELPAGENGLPDREKVKDWWFGGLNNEPMKLMLNEGQRAQQPDKTLAQKSGEFQGEKALYKGLGENKSEALKGIDQEQKVLSSTGNNLDQLINSFTNPDFMKLRETFPFLQDKQLYVAAHTGSKVQQEMVGNIIAQLEAFKGATVNSFKGQTLKREFEYADKLKPTEKDTIFTALGKLRALKTLKEIAYQKNNMVHDLIKNKKLDLTEAINVADKRLDIKGIEQTVKDVTQPLYRLKDMLGGGVIYVTKARAKELGAQHVKK